MSIEFKPSYIIHYTTSLIVDLRCPPPPVIKFGEFDTSTTLVGRSITFTCLEGYVFLDGAQFKTITCQGDPPEWDSQAIIDSLNCTGAYPVFHVHCLKACIVVFMGWCKTV